MRSHYVEPPPARHRIEVGARGEQLRLKLRRSWVMLIVTCLGLASLTWIQFLRVSMFGWRDGFQDLPSVIFAAIFALALLVSLVGQLAGAEIIRVVGRDLEISIGVGPLRRTWRYRGGEISNLTGMEADFDTDMWGIPVQRWLFARPKTGAVKFDYGMESIYFADSVGEPEGREIAAWLARRLPRGAVYGEG